MHLILLSNLKCLFTIFTFMARRLLFCPVALGVIYTAQETTASSLPTSKNNEGRISPLNFSYCSIV